jgi:type IV secretion system protein VirD4
MVLLDEFANLGPLQMVEQGAALISGYGVTLWPFVQNLSQLQKLYPNNWEVFIANAAAITVANVNDVTTAEYFSKRAGKTIKHLWSWSSSSTSGERASSTSGHSKSESIQDILPVEDIYNLRGDSGYVFFEGKAPPLIALKSNYDDKRLPWHGRAAENPMVKVWR